MTAVAKTSNRSSTGAARAAAAVTWVYAAGFGGSTVPVSIYLLKRGSLPSFFGLFDMNRPVVPPVPRQHLSSS
jgi:hypothetical protein